MKTFLPTSSSRSIKIDLLKALAIISVVFYHLGYQTFGYLGVDIFLVCGGYLFAKSIRKQLKADRFRYFAFLGNRLFRLFPAVVVATSICLLIGCFTLLPDDFENLAQSVFATNFFANNILSCITTKNYWDVVNEYKPLMHTWYLGILVQCYVILLLIPSLAKKFSSKQHTFCRHCFIGVAVFSLALYFLPYFSDAQKFYYPPFRLFELCIGAIVAYLPEKQINLKQKFHSLFFYTGYTLLSAILVALLFVPQIPFSATTKLLLTCSLTAALLVLFRIDKVKKPQILRNPLVVISQIGKISFSVFLWHQIVLAFLRNCYTTHFTFADIFMYLLVVSILSWASYVFIENKLTAVSANNKIKRITVIACACLCLVNSACSLLVYKNAGVVRDIPELSITTDQVFRGMHAQYCDRGYSYDKDFESEDKIKICVVGDSFGRDWINILLESNIAAQIEISYIFPHSPEYILSHANRLDAADYIFCSVSSVKTETPHEGLSDYYSQGKLYIIGNKSFGDSNNLIYNQRWKDNYFDLTTPIDPAYIQQNQRLRDLYGEFYIDMITPVISKNNCVRVFSEDKKFISQDCRHLTQSGAQYYASILDISWIK